MVKPAPTHGLSEEMCRSTVAALPSGLRYSGSSEILLASWPLAVCQSFRVAAPGAIAPPVPVANRSL
jgi:hypothetical protein